MYVLKEKSSLSSIKDRNRKPMEYMDHIGRRKRKMVDVKKNRKGVFLKIAKGAAITYIPVQGSLGLCQIYLLAAAK